MCHICRPHPWHREHNRQGVGTPVHWLCHDLTDSNRSAVTPSDAGGRWRIIVIFPRRNSGLPDRPQGFAGKGMYLLCWVFGCQGATRILIYAFGRMHQGCFGGLAGFPWVERKSIPEALFLAVASDALLHYAAYVQDKHRHIFRKSFHWSANVPPNAPVNALINPIFNSSLSILILY